MKKSIITSAIATAVLSQMASAAVITVIPGFNQPALSANTITFDEDLSGPLFGGTENEVSIALVPNAVVANGSVANLHAAPNPSSGNFLSTGSFGTATFTFVGVQKALSFLWGSVDTYNQIEFFLGGSSIFSASGIDISNPANGNTGPNGTAFVTFTDLKFDSFILKNNPTTYAFETDNFTSTAVPDGGASVALLGTSLLALAYGKRRLLVKKA